MSALLWLAASLLLLAALSSAWAGRAAWPPRARRTTVARAAGWSRSDPGRKESATFPLPPAPAAPQVALIIPARDEARNLPRLLRSLAAQTTSIEVLVVDGGGNGDLAALARETGARVVPEPALPGGWVGKSWACWQGRKAAPDARWLLFTDADTEYAPDAVARAIAEADARGVPFLTGLTRQELGTFAERVCMPPMFTLIQAATGGAGERSLSDPERAVANGQFLLFRADVYDALGGHEAVRGSVVEDLALARIAAAARTPAAFVSLDDLVRVRMYRGGREMFAGWRKNVAAGAARTPPLAFAATVATHAAGLLPAPVALAALAIGQWPAALLAGAGWAIMTARVAGERAHAEGPEWRHAAIHPVGYAFFGAVLAASWWDRATGRGALWKGRRYRV